MKRYIYYIATLLATFATTSCAEMMNDAIEAEKVQEYATARDLAQHVQAITTDNFGKE